MNKNQRTAIAGIILALSNSGKVKNTYSYELASWASLSGLAGDRTVSVYDHSRSCHISGRSNDGRRYSLYDYGMSGHISLTVDDKKARGYDYFSGYHFSASVRGNAVSIYDYETCCYYSYS